VIEVRLPAPLRRLAQVDDAVHVEVSGPVTQRTVLDALEASYPVLCGTIRDRATQRRRPFVRFYVGQEDLSHEPPDAPLPPTVAAGEEPFNIVGAMAGG
jgi:sulfur-carrier protein